MEMQPLLAALQLLRNDLTIIYADFERIEEHLKGGAASYVQRISDLKAHVDDMDRHLEEVLATHGVLGASRRLEGKPFVFALYFRLGVWGTALFVIASTDASSYQNEPRLKRVVLLNNYYIPGE